MREEKEAYYEVLRQEKLEKELDEQIEVLGGGGRRLSSAARRPSSSGVLPPFVVPPATPTQPTH